MKTKTKITTPALPKTTRYEIKVSTNSYAGNFERAMGAYVFGYLSQYGNDSEAALKKQFFAETAAVDDEGVFAPFLEYFHDEHGRTICHIEYPNNLVFHFHQDPLVLFSVICQRVRSFPTAWLAVDDFATPSLKIKNVELFALTTQHELIIEL